MTPIRYSRVSKGTAVVVVAGEDQPRRLLHGLVEPVRSRCEQLLAAAMGVIACGAMWPIAYGGSDRSSMASLIAEGRSRTSVITVWNKALKCPLAISASPTAKTPSAVGYPCKLDECLLATPSSRPALDHQHGTSPEVLVDLWVVEVYADGEQRQQSLHLGLVALQPFLDDVPVEGGGLKWEVRFRKRIERVLRFVTNEVVDADALERIWQVPLKLSDGKSRAERRAARPSAMRETFVVSSSKKSSASSMAISRASPCCNPDIFHDVLRSGDS